MIGRTLWLKQFCFLTTVRIFPRIILHGDHLAFWLKYQRGRMLTVLWRDLRSHDCPMIVHLDVLEGPVLHFVADCLPGTFMAVAHFPPLW